MQIFLPIELLGHDFISHSQPTNYVSSISTLTHLPTIWVITLVGHHYKTENMA